MRNLKTNSPDQLFYSEIQFPPIWQALLGLLVTSSLGIAYGSAVSSAWGWALGLALSAIALFWWFSKSIRISVSSGFLQIGKMKIEHEFIGKVNSFDQAPFLQRIRGEAHRQDVFILRNLSLGGVEIEIEDSRDPFCHWVVSSKHPSRLTSTLLDGKVNV